MASRPDVIAYDRHPDSALQKRSLLSNTRHQAFGLEAFVIPARFETLKLADLPGHFWLGAVLIASVQTD